MTPLLSPLHVVPHDPFRFAVFAATEDEIIARRIASAHKWRRRRQVLRVRAALFGRRKLHGRRARQTCAPYAPAVRTV